MSSDTIGTETLQLVIGVPKSVGDTRSAEQGIRVFPLILRGYSGFGINPANPWQPARPALKDQWHESQLQDGRSLAGVAVGNVIETIELKAAVGNRLELEGRINELSRFINQARSFFATSHQIEPVCLEWAALGGKGSQYALVYNIEMSVVYNYPGTGTDARATVTLVIEREPAWRGVPPGVSPRVWTYYTRGLLPGADYDFEDLGLSTSGALVEGTVYNRNEYDLAVDGGNYPSVTQNWLDIPAAQIPGDAPALTCLYISATAVVAQPLLISRISKPGDVPARGGSESRGRPLTINGADGTVSGAGSKQTDSSRGKRNADTGTQQVVSCPAGTTGMNLPGGGVGTSYKLSLNMMRGKYNVFARGFFSDSAPPDDGATLVLDARTAGNFTYALFEPVMVGGADKFSNSEIQTFIGTLNIPSASDVFVGELGGLFVEDSATAETHGGTELFFRLEITVASGETYNFIDLCLMPFDEPALSITSISSIGTTSHQIIDNTGYLLHGKRGVLAPRLDVQNDIMARPQPFQGNEITLVPGIDNRIALLSGSTISGATASQQALDMKIDIVPRWYGVRDS